MLAQLLSPSDWTIDFEITMSRAACNYFSLIWHQNMALMQDTPV